MEGHVINGGYLIITEYRGANFSFELKETLPEIVQDIKGNHNFEGEFSSYLKRSDLAKRKGIDFVLEEEEIQMLSMEFGLDIDKLKSVRHFDYAKAIIAKKGLEGSALNNGSLENLFVRQDNQLIYRGVFDGQDQIMFGIRVDGKFPSYEESWRSQEQGRLTVAKLKLIENHSAYLKGDFSGLPKELV